MSKNEESATKKEPTATTDAHTDSDDASVNSKPQARAFTLKSIGFGLIALLITIIITNYNDYVLGQSGFVQNQLPPGPYFLILCLVLVWNPIWQRLWKPAVLHRRELVVSLFIVLVGCWTAGSGLNRFFSYSIVNSWGLYENSQHYKNNRTMEFLPQHLFPLGGTENARNTPEIVQGEGADARSYNAEELVYQDFSTGIPADAEIPYAAWTDPVVLYPDKEDDTQTAVGKQISSIGPIFHWIALIGSFSICIMALSLIVHRQWSHYEQLSYPLAHIGSSFIDRQKGRSIPELFYKRSFWIAASFVFSFHLIRLLHAWYPTAFPDIVIHFWFGWITDIFPVINKSGTFGIQHFKWVFAIIGITYFLPREIGLSLGISQFLLLFCSAQVYQQTGTGIGGNLGNARVGAYFAYAAVILYTGRFYYWATLKKAVSFNGVTEHEADGVFAMRIFLAAYLALVCVLSVSFEIEWFVALCYSLTVLLLFLVITRITCETGIPYMNAGWNPANLLVSVFGVSAIGAAPIAMMYFIGSFLSQEPKECLMPYVSNGLKIAEKHNINLKRIATLGMAVVLLAIVFSMFFRIGEHYVQGSNDSDDPRGQRYAINNSLRSATTNISQLRDMGKIDSTGTVVEAASLLDIHSDSTAITYMVIGSLAVLSFFFLRFRFAGFPLHPVLFLVWGTSAMVNTAYVFFVGWAIRELIVRFGGGNVYQGCKPFFIGLIFGELIASMFGIGIGFAYHFSTIPDGGGLLDGNQPKPFSVIAR